MPILPIDSGRYGSNEIRKIFEEENRLRYQLNFEAQVALSQGKLRMIPLKASREIAQIARSNKITTTKIKELESISEHDTASLVQAISEYCSPTTRPWIHYGLTSNDVVDTSTSMQLKDAFKVIEPKIFKLISLLINRVRKYDLLPSVGRTHGQHASIISFGLKFTIWANELSYHIERIEEGKKRFLLCKTLGVVGTGSLMGSKALDVQDKVSKTLGLYSIEAATQVIPRERLAEVQFIISLIGSSLDKMATEIRNLQRTEIGEVEEPFKKGQLGSSAVPVKRNPIKSERISSLARILRSFSNIAQENISLWHERDLSNSANERFTIPMGIILLDEMINNMIRVIEGLTVSSQRILDNINKTKGRIFAEFILEALVKKGIPRMKAYESIQRVAFETLVDDRDFKDAIMKDPSIGEHLNKNELKTIFDPNTHLAASTRIIKNVIKRTEQIRKNYKPN
ncbi:MAG: adenylosuccinate lyase [Nitrososphaeraceae archaeon]|nr:adenylosuccinate lyase [Nitrososphaeraceae archaeon]